MLFVSEKARIEELIDIQEYDNDELFQDKTTLTKVAFTMAKLNRTKLTQNLQGKSLIIETIEGNVMEEFRKKCADMSLYSEKDKKLIKEIRNLSSQK